MTNTILALSSEVQAAVKTAQAKAREYTQATFTPGHLLWGLLQEDVGLHPLLHQLDKEIPKMSIRKVMNARKPRSKKPIK
jgi:ATP-dependent Clp protease ATP-binding subunit ClpA